VDVRDDVDISLSRTQSLHDSQTPALLNSRTPCLSDSMTPRLHDTPTPRLQHSSTPELLLSSKIGLDKAGVLQKKGYGLLFQLDTIAKDKEKG